MINRDQAVVLRMFRHLGIRNMVIGGQAMQAYGIDRPTRDLDIWIARDEANAAAMLRFLERVQNQPPLERLTQPNFRFTVGDPAHPEVDILTSVAGDPSFDEMFARCLHRPVADFQVDIVSAQDLVTIKRAAAEKHEAEAAAGNLSVDDQRQAEGAGRKERRDIALLEVWIAANP